MRLSPERRVEQSRQPSTAASECWVYTRSGGLREVTLSVPPRTMWVDGQQLRPWCVLDRSLLGCAIAIVYSAEAPSRELRDVLTRRARERFASRPWFQKLVDDLVEEAAQRS